MNSYWLTDSIWGRLFAWLVYDGPAALGNHLWQSTLLALGIAVLALLLRRHAARVRHALWMVASLKFLVPFAALAALGAQIPWHSEAGAPAAAAPPALAAAAEFAAPLAPVEDHWQLLMPARESSGPLVRFMYSLLLPALALLWVLGTLLVVTRWWLRWRGLRRTLRASVPTSGVAFPAPVSVTAEAIEPGIVGIVKPVLLLPQGIEERLTPEQMRAVLAHEHCHLRRRDNLTAALHMLVEALFWYHPLVWWIGARLIDERERACDEQVVREGHAPQRYAEAILGVCEHYIASRLPCVSGVSGSDLRQRVQSIMKNPLIARLDASKRFVLATLACIAVATPIAAGVVSWRSAQGRTLYRNAIMQYWSVLAGNQNAPGTCSDYSADQTYRQRRLADVVGRLEADDGSKALLLAVLANSAQDARRLLAGGAARGGDGFLLEDSLMHVAARFGDPAMLQVLFDAGFPVDAFAGAMGAGGDSAASRTALMIAISVGRHDNVDWLLAHGADVNATNRSRNTALTYAIAVCRDQALATKLIQAGARPDERTQNAAARLNFDLSAAPASPGASPAQAGAPASADERPYDIAVRQAHDVNAAHLRSRLVCPGRSTEVQQAQLALRETVARLSVGDGEQVLRFAVLANSEADVRRLLAAGASRQGNGAVLQVAARLADAPVLNVLLEAAGYGPAARDQALLRAAQDGRTDNVAWLIGQGANANAAISEGGTGTALVYSMQCRSQMLVNLLLRAGARVDASVRDNARTYGLELPTGTVALARGTLDPPRGWHSLTPEELASQPMRGNSPSLYTEAHADLDGDGREDRAALFAAADGASEGLFVKLSSADADHWQLAASVTHAPPARDLRMGIGVEKAGTYATACAKGYDSACGPGEATEVTLQRQAIRLFAFEGASSLVYWDGTTRTFRRVWTSD